MFSSHLRRIMVLNFYGLQTLTNTSVCRGSQQAFINVKTELRKPS
ncbi:hypothetical protein BTN49_1873 [Candidatus Enterovibrio escicola]|uniref:Uncharacterized protein n=1 Tax=Candidatus Enterovibrio escicola TaxID=1927127 RepID=A0A2A5T2Z1_9GAMM|nr:hypothetical protein BTN49_1873 [Candidatus Enterovibrio escacola]